MKQQTSPFRRSLSQAAFPINPSLSHDSDRGEFQARLSEAALNPARTNMLSITKDKTWVEARPFCDHAARYGLGMLNQPAIELIRELTAPRGHRLVSVFTGLGYAEAQLASQGMDVIGFDKEVHANRWLEGVYKGPAGQKLSRFADRALFMSFPDRNEGRASPAAVLREYLAAEGDLVLVVTEQREHLHAFGCDKAFFDSFRGARCLETIELPAWPELVALSAARYQYSDFKPVLRAYLFDR